MVSIKKEMLKHHGEIFKILNDVEKYFDSNVKLSNEFFSKFKWEIEKHFFIEERVIFKIYSSIKLDEVSDVFELLKQHGIIQSKINNLIGNPKSKTKISELKKLIFEHSQFEDNYFYPKVDKILDEEQKNRIMLRINDIVMFRDKNL